MPSSVKFGARLEDRLDALVFVRLEAVFGDDVGCDRRVGHVIWKMSGEHREFAVTDKKIVRERR